MADLTVVLHLRGDDAGAVRATANVTRGLRDVEQHSIRADRSVRAINTSLRAVGDVSRGAVGGVGRLVDGFGRLGLAAVGVHALARAMGAVKDALQAPIAAASDLSETANKVEVVFGAAHKQVREFGLGAAAAIGQSNRQAQAAAATFGNLFTTIGLGQKPAADMSIALVRLASDLASFHNADPSEVLEALRSGLVGETEPMRRFGVLLNETTVKQRAMAMGAKEVNGQLSEAAKVQARYALILQQSGAAQGDFARTSTGLANSLRIIRAHWQDIVTILGEELLPVITPLVAEFAQKLPSLIERARPHIQRFGETLRNATTVAVEGLQVLWQAFQTVLPGIVSIVGQAGQLVWQGLQWLNPFARHSPSLVEQVEAGLARITAMYAGLPGAISPHLAAMGGELDKQQEALARAEAALLPYERALERVSRSVRLLGDALNDAQADLKRFQSAQLAGERAFDDRLFGLDQERARLRLRQLDMEERGPGTGFLQRIAFAQQRRALEQRLAQIDRESERTRLQRQITIDPQRRALEQIGRAPEMTFEEAMRGAQEAFARVQQLAPAYAAAQAQTEKLTADLQAQKDLLQDQRDILAQIRAARAGAGAAGGGLGLPGLLRAGMGGPSGPSPNANTPSETREDIAQPAWVIQAKLALANFRDVVDGIKTKLEEAQKAIDGFKTAFEKDWKPAFEETGKVIKMVLDGDIGGAITRVSENLESAWPKIEEQLGKWGDVFDKKVKPAAESALDRFGTWLGSEENLTKIENATAGWVDAVLSFLGKAATGFGTELLKTVGVWKTRADDPDVAESLGELGAKLGLAVLRGFYRGLFSFDKVFTEQSAEWWKGIRERLGIPAWVPDMGWGESGGGGGERGFPGRGRATDNPSPGGPPPAGGGSRGFQPTPGVPGARGRQTFGLAGPDGQFVAVPVGAGDGAATPAGRSGGNTLVIQGPLVEHISVTNEADEDRLVAKISAMLADGFDQAAKRDARRPHGLSRAGV